MAYDDNNIFAKILRGELPCHKVYEDENFLAFLDVMPQAAGHTLVIPKAPSRNLLDADPKALDGFLPLVQKIALATVKAFNADGVSVFQYNGAAGGQSVFHLHMHVVPRHDGVALRRHKGEMEDGDVLAGHAEKIRAELEG